jgi:four helix bundle protein
MDERFSMTDQMRRSARSVCANLAEAWRKRRYPNHFVSKISDAESEAAETQVWLDFALEFGFIDSNTHKSLTQTYDVICSQLAVMASQPDKWVPKPAASSSK